MQNSSAKIMIPLSFQAQKYIPHPLQLVRLPDQCQNFGVEALNSAVNAQLQFQPLGSHQLPPVLYQTKPSPDKPNPE